MAQTVGVALGGTGVFVGATGVSVGATGVSVGGSGVAVEQPPVGARCRMRVRWLAPSLSLPTAHSPPVPSGATAASLLYCALLGLGLSTGVHLDPSQCS